MTVIVDCVWTESETTSTSRPTSSGGLESTRNIDDWVVYVLVGVIGLILFVVGVVIVVVCIIRRRYAFAMPWLQVK